MQHRVLLDLDGLIVNFVKGACKVHNKQDPYEGGNNTGRYDIANLLGLSSTAFWKPMNVDFWKELEPTAEAHDMVDAVSRRFGVENICILSSPNLSHDSMVGKLLWVEKHFPEFRRQFLFGPRKKFCAAPNHILIDDYDENVDDFIKSGGIGYLFPRPWNKLHALNSNESLLNFYSFLTHL